MSSQAPDEEHFIEPLRFTGDAEAAWRRLQVVVASYPRTAIIQDEGRYLHAEATSRVFRFVDDVDFLMDLAANVIHVRSASRTGYSDFGVNRRRVEDIRKRFNEVDAHNGSNPGATPR